VSKSASDIFIARLRQLRERHNLTQEEFSELSGISYKYVQHMETSYRRDVRLSTIERVARVYGLDACQMIAPEMPETKLKKRRKG
jgi:transcriptional regulator with XRE-family HTH domain